MNKKKNRAYYLFVLSRYIQNYRIKFFFGAIINIVYKIVPVAVAFLVSYMVGAGITGRVYEVKLFYYYGGNNCIGRYISFFGYLCFPRYSISGSC